MCVDLKGLGAFAGVSDTQETNPVARFFILGFFAQNVTFGRTDFFQHSPHLRAPPLNFFVFQNPEVRYFVQMTRNAENFCGSVVYGSWASR